VCEWLCVTISSVSVYLSIYVYLHICHMRSRFQKAREDMIVCADCDCYGAIPLQVNGFVSLWSVCVPDCMYACQPVCVRM
jgi:hypothetical protein